MADRSRQCGTRRGRLLEPAAEEPAPRRGWFVGSSGRDEIIPGPDPGIVQLNAGNLARDTPSSPADLDPGDAAFEALVAGQRGDDGGIGIQLRRVDDDGRAAEWRLLLAADDAERAACPRPEGVSERLRY